MKKIGIIGGMSWESTALYYKEINELVKKELGGLHSAECLIYSLDFQEIESYQVAAEWDKSAIALIKAAKSLECGGADFIIIATNTMHKVYKQVQDAINIPILHIATVTADEIINNNLKTVALLGTKYTMEQDFYKQKLIDYNINVIVPDEANQKVVSNIIYNELCLGLVNEESKEKYLSIIEDLIQKGAQGIILGCTEIGLLINQNDIDIKLFDTTLIHAQSATYYALKK